MVKFFKGRFRKVGLPPGTILYTDESLKAPLKLDIFRYDVAEFEEKENVDPVKESYLPREEKVSWINIEGLHNPKAIEQFCASFNIHPLTIEDILTPEQRPKMEDNLDYLFLVMKMLFYNNSTCTVESEQISLILGKNYLVSFQEKPGDNFAVIRQRLRTGAGRIRKMDADFLFYALIDAIVDNYFVLLEKVGDRLEEIEDDLLTRASENTLNALHKIKKEIISLRRSVWPLREVIYKLEREDIGLIKGETRIFFRDVYDHTIQIIETVETFRDMVSGLIDLYQSTISARLNQVMKVLTIISTIFIPLTFITGLYGMNFEYIPELSWRYGYFAVWGFSIAVVGIMLAVFRKKRWI